MPLRGCLPIAGFDAGVAMGSLLARLKPGNELHSISHHVVLCSRGSHTLSAIVDGQMAPRLVRVLSSVLQPSSFSQTRVKALP